MYTHVTIYIGIAKHKVGSSNTMVFIKIVS